MSRTLTAQESERCSVLLEDAAVMIDEVAPDASYDVKKIVSCRMVSRALGDENSGAYPLGTSQGSMSALGYSQSFTVGGGGSIGELYLGKAEKRLLGIGNRIGARSPLEDMTCEAIL